MQYLWEKFNIKTFPANTRVYLDGVLRSDLSFESEPDLPTHIIYIGEIEGEKRLEIECPKPCVFLTAKIDIKNPAFLTIFCKNTGKNFDFSGKVFIHNYSDLKLNIKAEHLVENTGIFVETRLVAHDGSKSKLSGVAEIATEGLGCRSDIKFLAMAMPKANITFSPAQRIAAVPESAGHSASLWRPTSAQVQFLSQAGLSMTEAKSVLEQSFLDFSF